MFGIRLVARNVVRHKYKSILHILIGAFTVLILNIYAGTMDSTKDQLTKLPEVLEVSAKISTLNGSLTEGMTIREDRMMGVRESEYVKNPVFTVRLKFGLGAFAPEEYAENLNYYGVGINAAAGVPGMKREEITFIEGVDETIFETSQKVCVLDAELMVEEGLCLGDDAVLTIYYYRYETEGSEVFIEPLTTGTYRIVGMVEIEEYTGGFVSPDAILPLDCVREAYHSQGIPFFADSGSFTVKDPFLLNELKAQMSGEVGFLPVITRAQFRYNGNALTIRDETFIRSAETLRRNLALLQGMLPFLLVIVIFIGYLCSYLSLQSRRGEYALMRSLGTGRGRSFWLLFGEAAIVAVTACIPGSLMAAAFFGMKVEVLVMADALFFFAFSAGTAAALFSLCGLSVMELLTGKE